MGVAAVIVADHASTRRVISSGKYIPGVQAVEDVWGVVSIAIGIAKADHTSGKMVLTLGFDSIAIQVYVSIIHAVRYPDDRVVWGSVLDFTYHSAAIDFPLPWFLASIIIIIGTGETGRVAAAVDFGDARCPFRPIYEPDHASDRDFAAVGEIILPDLYVSLVRTVLHLEIAYAHADNAADWSIAYGDAVRVV